MTPVSLPNWYNNYANYSLDSSYRSFNSATKSSASIVDNYTTASRYNSTSGYGLVNAGAAVAEASGQNTFADVSNLGGNNWGADLIKAPEAWAKGYTGKGVVVAVLDTGVDYNHPDLKDNIWTNPNPGTGKDNNGNAYVNDIHGWNFVDNNNDVMDKDGHGTHVSGTIAGENNGFGVTGIAYDAKIMAVKVLDDSGAGSYSSITNGIYYAVNHGANVINLSLGSTSPDSSLESALKYASSKNVIVAMAAGNDGGTTPEYPAHYAQNVGFAVGAVDQSNKIAYFSNRSGSQSFPYVTAPGVNVYSTIPGNKYAYYSGTSMASPHVAGLIALMLSANHNLSESQVSQIITSTAGNSTQSTQPSLSSNYITKSIAATSSNIASYQNNSFAVSPTQPTSELWADLPKNQLASTNNIQYSSLCTNYSINNDTFVNSDVWPQYMSYVTTTLNSKISANDNTDADNIFQDGKTFLEESQELLVGQTS
ncbi:MAG: S8 family peptidase [Rhizonema sp. PD38]|nr:S8 family peptidase [Rhizonema sp. PD38]